MNEDMMQDIYNRYFSKEDNKSTVLSPEPCNDNIYDNKKSARVHMNESIHIKNGYGNISYQHVADDNIDDIEQLADILKKLCNAAWGSDWGELSPDLKRGEKSSEIIIPQITIEINTRDIAEGIGGPKPTLVDIINEEDANGNSTGDAFLIYRQWFECNVEFNFYGRTSKEARQLQKKFETLIAVYAGYLKRNGISEIMFQQEVSPKCSLNYKENIPMRCVYYYIRFENITSIRQSLINSINIEIGASQIDATKVKTLIATSDKPDILDIDFFDGDNEITYNFDN